MKLYLVGAGGPIPTSRGFGSCFVLQLEDDFLMIDCGPSATQKMVKIGLSPIQIDQLFFTHHHFDHNADYACFLLTRWCHLERSEQLLQVWGPAYTEQITDLLIGPQGAFSIDWKARLAEWSTRQDDYSRRGPPAVEAHDIKPGLILEKRGWRVTAAQAKHQEPEIISMAYRVDTEAGSVAFGGDTLPCRSVSALVSGADALVISCWDLQEEMSRRPYPLVLSGTLEVAALAKEAGVKKLIIVHTHPRLIEPGHRESAIDEIGRVFDGEIVMGEELQIIQL